MNCSKCNKKATISTPFGERDYCDKHFMEFIEKRIRKDLRTKQTLDVKKSYFIYNNKSHKYKITKHFLKNIFGDILKLKELTKENSKKQNVIIPRSLEDESDEFLDSFLKNNILKEKKVINPLRTILEIELSEICRILKINYKSKKHNELVENLEQSYHGTKFSVMKSKNFIKKNKKIKERH